MGRSPDYARYLRMAVEHQHQAEDAESQGEDPASIASHFQRAAHYRAMAEQAALVDASAVRREPRTYTSFTVRDR